VGNAKHLWWCFRVCRKCSRGLLRIALYLSATCSDWIPKDSKRQSLRQRQQRRCRGRKSDQFSSRIDSSRTRLRRLTYLLGPLGLDTNPLASHSSRSAQQQLTRLVC
jgi:hypothetical protein